MDASSSGSDHVSVTRPLSLASGIDAFYVSGRFAPGEVLPSAMFDRLVTAKASAQTSDDPVEVVVGGESFAVSPRGLGVYPIALLHEHGVIGVSDSDRLPTFRVQPRALFLHAGDPFEAVGWFRSLIEAAVESDLVWSPSRLDLFVDLQGVSFDVSDLDRFVCRSRHVEMFFDQGALTGFEFGRRASGTVSARIYDKSAEIRTKGLDHWYGIWGEDWDPTLPVWRIEFEFHRRALTQLGVNGIHDVPDALGGLWAYGTESWLRHTTPTADQTRSRWPDSPAWVDAQQAPLRKDAVPRHRLRKLQSLGTLRRLTPILNGCLTSFAALSGCRTLDETLVPLIQVIEDYADDTGRSYEQQVDRKLRPT